MRTTKLSTYELKRPQRKCCCSVESAVRRQNSVCVVTTPAGTIAAMSVTRLPTAETSRYARRGALESAVRQEPPGFLRRSRAAWLRPDRPRTAERACPRSTGRPAAPNDARSSRHVELAAELKIPSLGTAERRERRAATCPSRSRSAVRSRVRNAACPSADESRAAPASVGSGRPTPTGRREPAVHRAPRSCARRIARAPRACGRRHPPRRPRSAGRDEWERVASALSRPTIVSSADRSSNRARKIRRAVVGRKAPRQHQADAAAGPRERQRALEKRLVQVHVAAIARLGTGLTRG